MIFGNWKYSVNKIQTNFVWLPDLKILFFSSCLYHVFAVHLLNVLNFKRTGIWVMAWWSGFRKEPDCNTTCILWFGYSISICGTYSVYAFSIFVCSMLIKRMVRWSFTMCRNSVHKIKRTHQPIFVHAVPFYGVALQNSE